MNPQLHDEFIALCALFFSGELTDEEWALLQVHLAYCDSCRDTFEEFQRVHQQVVPAMAAAAASEHPDNAAAARFSLGNAEQRLMEELDRIPAPKRKQASGKTKWRVAAGLIGILVLGTVWLSLLQMRHSEPSPRLEATATKTTEPAPPAVTPVKPVPLLHPSSEIAGAKADQLEQKLKSANARYRQLTVTAKDVQQQLAAVQAQEQETSSERDALREQLAQAQAEVQTLQAKSAAVSSAAQNQAARLVNLQTTVDVLNSSLNEKDRMLALDRQFLDHDREIRDLIAARHLYIADIYDVKDDGETAKPFGRVFYTKDQSLVFYGYDLDRLTRHNRLVSFQVWGSGNDQPNVSLGLFSRNKQQNYWILHFNDTKTLARLNRVFVTVEPPGGSNKPTGKQILMAYLRIQPNHP